MLVNHHLSSNCTCQCGHVTWACDMYPSAGRSARRCPPAVGPGRTVKVELRACLLLPTRPRSAQSGPARLPLPATTRLALHPQSEPPEPGRALPAGPLVGQHPVGSDNTRRSAKPVPSAHSPWDASRHPRHFAPEQGPHGSPPLSVPSAVTTTLEDSACHSLYRPLQTSGGYKVLLA